MHEDNKVRNPHEEEKQREILQLIQSSCVHRRRGIIRAAKLRYQKDIVYCQDCEKILYHLSG